MVPAHRIGDGAALVDGDRRAGLGGRDGQAARQHLQPGKRTPNWRKVKNRHTVEVVIGGYTPGTGNRDVHVRRAAGRRGRAPTA